MTLAMRGIGIGGMALLTGAMGIAAPAAASGQDPTLARVESLVTAGDYDAARAALGQWWSATGTVDAPGSDMAHGLMLRARLAPDPAAAESDYLGVVLGYPTSDQAPEALLRLGQGLLATGDAVRAAAYLERLVADYPGRPQRIPGLLWLARANSAARRAGAACTAARHALEEARDADLVAMLRVEEGASCSRAAPTVATPSPAATPAAVTAPAGRPASTEPQGRARGGAEVAADAPIDLPPEATTGRWAVQTGAFRYRAGADALMERLRTAGHAPRLVKIPLNDLLRVRVGRFTSSGEASRLLNALRRQGFDAVVVSDAGEERQP